MEPIKTIDLSSYPTQNRYTYVEREPDRWCSAIGAWGDTFACLGEFYNYPGEGGICHYGWDATIGRFLARQKGVQAVEQIQPRSQEEYKRIASETSSHEDFPLPFTRRIVPTHLRPSVHRGRRINHWHGARLDRWAYESAALICENLPGDFFLLQPFSTQSCPMDQQWAHWEEAIQLLLVYTPYTYVLVGAGWQACGEHPRIVNLVGNKELVPDMMTVFALAERAKGIVTTVNSLAIYSVIQSLPAVAVANGHLPKDCFFHRWINKEPVSLVEQDGTFKEFLEAFTERFRP